MIVLNRLLWVSYRREFNTELAKVISGLANEDMLYRVNFMNKYKNLQGHSGGNYNHLNM